MSPHSTLFPGGFQNIAEELIRRFELIFLSAFKTLCMSFLPIQIHFGKMR